MSCTDTLVNSKLREQLMKPCLRKWILTSVFPNLYLAWILQSPVSGEFGLQHFPQLKIDIITLLCADTCFQESLMNLVQKG